MAFTFRETQIVLGMLERGDRQHDIAAFFGVNGGRVAEVATGRGDYPTATAAPREKLPPPGPYVSPRSVHEIRSLLSEALIQLQSSAEIEDPQAHVESVLLAALSRL
jgi:hypothetical protein